MESHEALAKTINRHTVAIAKDLGLSTSLINKWQLPHTDFTDSGAYNPLDRIEAIIEQALKLNPQDAFTPIKWLAEKFGLILIPLPADIPLDTSTLSLELLKTIEEFGDLARVAAEALSDNSLSRSEAKNIQREGHELIRQTSIFMHMVDRVAGKI